MYSTYLLYHLDLTSVSICSFWIGMPLSLHIQFHKDECRSRPETRSQADTPIFFGQGRLNGTLELHGGSRISTSSFVEIVLHGTTFLSCE